MLAKRPISHYSSIIHYETYISTFPYGNHLVATDKDDPTQFEIIKDPPTQQKFGIFTLTSPPVDAEDSIVYHGTIVNQDPCGPIQLDTPNTRINQIKGDVILSFEFDETASSDIIPTIQNQYGAHDVRSLSKKRTTCNVPSGGGSGSGSGRGGPEKKKNKTNTPFVTPQALTSILDSMPTAFTPPNISNRTDIPQSGGGGQSSSDFCNDEATRAAIADEQARIAAIHQANMEANRQGSAVITDDDDDEMNGSGEGSSSTMEMQKQIQTQREREMQQQQQQQQQQQLSIQQQEEITRQQQEMLNRKELEDFNLEIERQKQFPRGSGAMQPPTSPLPDPPNYPEGWTIPFVYQAQQLELQKIPSTMDLSIIENGELYWLEYVMKSTFDQIQQVYAGFKRKTGIFAYPPAMFNLLKRAFEIGQYFQDAAGILAAALLYKQTGVDSNEEDFMAQFAGQVFLADVSVVFSKLYKVSAIREVENDIRQQVKEEHYGLYIKHTNVFGTQESRAKVRDDLIAIRNKGSAGFASFILHNDTLIQINPSILRSGKRSVSERTANATVTFGPPSFTKIQHQQNRYFDIYGDSGAAYETTELYKSFNWLYDVRN